MASNYKRFTTPKGLALFPQIVTPDTKFNPEGDYHIDILIDPEKAGKMAMELENIRDNFMEENEDVQKAKAKSKKPLLLADVYEETDEGLYKFKFKQKAKIKTKDGKVIEVKIPVFDSFAKPVNTKNLNMGNKSEIKVCFEAVPYFMPATRTVGLSLRLNAVQLIKLVEYGGQSAESYGFGEEYGGYSYEATEEEDSEVEAYEEEATEEEPAKQTGMW